MACSRRSIITEITRSRVKALRVLQVLNAGLGASIGIESQKSQQSRQRQPTDVTEDRIVLGSHEVNGAGVVGCHVRRQYDGSGFA